VRRHCILLVILLLPAAGWSQTPAIGTPPWASFTNGGFDAINNQNGNVLFAVPVVSAPARGGNFSVQLLYNSLIWQNSGTAWTGLPTGAWGWYTNLVALGSSGHFQNTESCDTVGRPQFTTHYRFFHYTESSGVNHSFDMDFYSVATLCGYNTTPRTGYATDGTG
jgi:hypothetical protein